MKIFLALAVMVLPALGFSLDISAESAIVIDGGSGKILWSKNPDTPRFPASTTKIMTTLLMLEHCSLNDVIVAPADVEKVKESSMHLKPGERVTVRDMAYALMLRSANDGCYAVAVHIAGSVEAFSKMMNDRAKEIGCTHTHFHNPNGLNDAQHTTTAHDLALMGREAMKNSFFCEVVRTKKHEIDRSINVRDRTMINHDRYLKYDSSADGIKTGYTVPAGHCFVGSATRKGFHVITVVLKSKNWQEDHKKLLEMAFRDFRVQAIMSKGAEVVNVPILGGATKEVPAAVSEDVQVLSQRGEKSVVTKRFKPIERITAPVKRGQKVGDLIICQSDGSSQSIPVVAMSDVAGRPQFGKFTQSGPVGSFEVMGAALGAGALYMRGRGRRISKSYGRSRTGPLKS